MSPADRAVRTAHPGLVTGAGLLVMVGAAVAASRYTPFWFDVDDGCRLLGRCPGPATDAALHALWVVEWAGVAVVLLGLLLTWRRLRTTPIPPAVHLLPAWAEAAAGSLAGTAMCLVLGPFAFFLALLSEPGAVAGLCLYWLVQASAVTALDRSVGPVHRSRWPGWLAGLVISAVAIAAVVGSAIAGAHGELGVLPVVDGAVVALGLLLWRGAAWRAGRAPAGARPWSPTGAGIAVLAVAFSGLLVWNEVSPADAPAPDVAVSAPPRAAPPEPAAPSPSAAPPAPVQTAVACSPDDLTWGTTGWDAAMGTRAVTVVATNHAAHPCYVDGFADIAIAQGGHTLRLATEPGSPTEPGAPAAQRVGLAVEGAASFPLVWKGYGAAADQRTPQALTVTLPGADAVTVPLGPDPAPFDLVDGGTVRVGPWSPRAPL